MKFVRQWVSKGFINFILMGIGITIIGILLAAFVFGLTFGTAGIITVGLILSVYSFTLIQTGNEKLSLTFLITRRLISISILLVLTSFICIEVLIFQSIKSNDNVNVKYAVVLGAGIDGEQPSLTLRRRLDSSIKFLNENPDAKLIASGGFGAGLRVSEAEVMKRYLIEQGINEERILKEERSKTSDENLKYTRALLRELNGEQLQDILVITSDYHMFRAKLIASRYFSQVYGMASNTPTTIMINYSIREYLAVLKLLGLAIVQR